MSSGYAYQWYKIEIKKTPSAGNGRGCFAAYASVILFCFICFALTVFEREGAVGLNQA